MPNDGAFSLLIVAVGSKPNKSPAVSPSDCVVDVTFGVDDPHALGEGYALKNCVLFGESAG